MTLAAILIAASGARGTMLANDGSDHFQQSIREEVKRGAALVEDVRLVYQDEAPVALEIAEARSRARSNSRLFAELPAPVGSFAGVQSAADGRLAQRLTADAEKAARALDSASAASGSSAGEQFDALLRLSVVRNLHPQLADLDPDIEESHGASDLKATQWLAATALLGSLAFFAGALAQALPRRRPSLVRAGFVCLALGAVSGLLVGVST